MSFFRSVVASTLLLHSADLAAQETARTPKTYVLDGRSLPLGNGKVSDGPKKGYVYSCQTEFRGGGAQHTGPWIHGTTWDETQKTIVQGDVAWPNASFLMDTASGMRELVGNALPVGHTTGIFPVQRSDPAFQIDRNPNTIQEQQVTLSLPLMPEIAETPSCVPMGAIGVALNGVAIFNALDAGGNDAVANEVQDHCNGHPERSGQYHYHGLSKCLQGAMMNNKLVGYALDGFGIYSMFDEKGREMTNADLDECHGRTSPVLWDGKKVTMYHYVLTREYPYTVSCFRGVPIKVPRDTPSASSMRREGPPKPPEEAITACNGWVEGASCSFVSPRGDTISGTCHMIGGTTACAPARRQ